MNFKAPVVAKGKETTTAKRNCESKNSRPAPQRKPRKKQTVMSDIFAGSKLVVVKASALLKWTPARASVATAVPRYDVAALNKQNIAVVLVSSVPSRWGGC